MILLTFRHGLRASELCTTLGTGQPCPRPLHILPTESIQRIRSQAPASGRYADCSGNKNRSAICS